MPTPCIDGALPSATPYWYSWVKWLSASNISKSVLTGMPTSKLFIFFIFLVRDQEVGGSNPLAPTTLFSTIYTLSLSEKVVGANNGTEGARTSAEPHPVEPFE
jgi:hypothetical protein